MPKEFKIFNVVGDANDYTVQVELIPSVHEELNELESAKENSMFKNVCNILNIKGEDEEAFFKNLLLVFSSSAITMIAVRIMLWFMGVM